MNKNVFLLSGQGSQYYQMGAQLYKDEERFNLHMKRLDKLVQPRINRSIVDILYHENKEKSQPFTRILYTIPAVFMVEYCLARTLMDVNIIPDYLLGASLGEYVALTLAGVLPLEDMLDLLIRRAKRVEKNCEPGAMIGVIADPDLYGREPVLNKNSSLGGVSSNRYFVLSGFREKMEPIKAFLREKKISHQELPISYGFHSPNIYPGFERGGDLSGTDLLTRPLQLPGIHVISCLTGKKLVFFEDDYLGKVAKNCVQFAMGLATLNREKHNFNYIDLGPSGTDAGFVRQSGTLGKSSRIYRIMTPLGDGYQKFKKIRDELGKRSS
jgi:bacillaene synthase trans-acting acyltransferase